MSETSTTPRATPAAECVHCGKVPSLCICDEITPIDNRIELVVLQHPQEQDKVLGSARVAVRNLARAQFRIGLSWPGLNEAVGRPVDPKRWGILHLGSIQAEQFPEGRDLAAFDGKGEPLPGQAQALKGLEGVIVLDGTWAQAKTLWWRNSWVLKTTRLALKPADPSLYGKLRKEPRREGLSTIEATGMLLARLEGRPEIEETLKETFQLMLGMYKVAKKRGLLPKE